MTAPATKQTIEGASSSPAQAQGLATLRALRDSDKILYARNIGDKTITCRENNGSINVDFLLEIGELAIIPKEALYVRGFLRCWQRNEVKISDSEEMENEFLLDMDGRVVEQQARQADVMSKLTANPTQNDIQQLKCLESQHQGGEAPPVLQRVKDTKDGVPPLCDHHKHLAHQYIGDQQQDGSWKFQKMGGVSR